MYATNFYFRFVIKCSILKILVIYELFSCMLLVTVLHD